MTERGRAVAGIVAGVLAALAVSAVVALFGGHLPLLIVGAVALVASITTRWTLGVLSER